MTRLNEKDTTYFTTVRGMCRKCRDVVPARVFFRDGSVWQQSLCPTCSNEPALIAADQDWYLANVLKPMPDRSPLPSSRLSQRGCPHDCGPCAWHASPCQLPVVSITNACNLRCPICFTYNRADRLYHMSIDEMRRTIDGLLESTGTVDLINITGGEPTLHPQILDLLEVARRPEIGRVTMNSNGIRLAEDMRLCEELAARDVHLILSLNTFDPEVSRRLHGHDLTSVKQRAIENLTHAGVKITLLNVMIHNENEEAIAGIFELMRANDNILSLTVQTMTYTGQGGGQFGSIRHVPIDRAAQIVCQHSGGSLQFDDFLTRPSAHPLCYLICYMLKSGEKLLPLARLSRPEKLAPLLKDSYLIRPGNEDDFFTDAINNLYAVGKTEHLAVLRQLVDKLYPVKRPLTNFERQRVAESQVRTVYLHAHMDEDTFDCSRAMLCPDQVPTEQGRLIPACTYNLFQRREDERFYINTAESNQ